MNKTLGLRLLLVTWMLACNQPGVAQSTDASELKLLTWNVYLLGAGTNRVGRTPEITNSINDSSADVIVLAEMFSNRASRRILRATRETFPFRTNVLGRRGGWEDGGIVILSRFPISRSAEHIFQASAFEDAFSNKGVMYASIDKTIGEVSNRFHIFATHTQADALLEEKIDQASGPFRERHAVSKRARRLQFDEIRQFIAEQEIPDSELVIIAGDLNVDFYDTEEYQVMLNRLNSGAGDLRRMGSQPSADNDSASDAQIVSAPYPTTYSSSTNSILDDDDGYELILDYALFSLAHKLPALVANRIVRFSNAEIGDFSDHYGVLSTFHLDNNRVCRNSALSLNNSKNPVQDYLLSITDISKNNRSIAQEFILSGNDIRLLCGTAKRLESPVRCYNSVVSGALPTVDISQWSKQQAISLCSSNVFTQSRLTCFNNRINENKTPQQARDLCNPSTAQVWPDTD